MKKTLINQLPGIIAAVLFMVGLNAFAAWSGPTGTPYNDNVNPPIHEGADIQIKFANVGSTIFNLGGEAAIRTNALQALLGLVTEERVVADEYCFFDPGLTYGENLDANLNSNCFSSIPTSTSTSITIPGIDPGSIHETLRFDGSNWVSNGLLKNDDSTVSVIRPIPFPLNCTLTPNPSGGLTGFLGTPKVYAQTPAGCDVDIFQALGEMPNGNTRGLVVTGQGTTVVDQLIDFGSATFNAGSDDQIRISSGRVYGDVDFQNNIFVDGETHLKRTVITGGEILSSWGGTFDWGGGGRFNVSTVAEFENDVRVGEDEQTADVNVIGNVNVARQPNFPSGYAYKRTQGASSVGSFPGVTDLGSISISTFQQAFPNENINSLTRINVSAGGLGSACSDNSFGSFSGSGDINSSWECNDTWYSATIGSPVAVYDLYLGRDTLADGSFKYYPKYLKWEKEQIDTNQNTGKVDTAALKVRDGAGAGKVLVSDSDGDAIWTDPNDLNISYSGPVMVECTDPGQVNSDRCNNDTGNRINAIAVCPAGTNVVGGGVRCHRTGLSNSDPGPQPAIVDSYPVEASGGLEDRWFGRCAMGGGYETYINVYAICQ